MSSSRESSWTRDWMYVSYIANWTPNIVFMVEFLCKWHSVQFSLSVVSDSLWPHGCSTTGLLVHHQLLKFTQTHVHWVSDAIQSSHPLSSPSPTFNLSQHQGLCKWAFRIRGLKYWSFCFNISTFNEYSGLIYLRMNWLDILAMKETLTGLLQHHSSKASILWSSAFFIFQLSHLYVTTGKTIALTGSLLAK